LTIGGLSKETRDMAEAEGKGVNSEYAGKRMCYHHKNCKKWL
jgi:hypothetical protein